MKYVNTILAAVGVAMLAGAPAQATELSFLTSWNSNYRGTEGMAEAYVDLVTKASNGKITFRVAGPETVPPFEQLEPVQAGVFDMLFTHTAYHAGATTMNIAVDAMVNDPARRRSAGVFEFVDKHYQTLGLKLLSLPASGGIHFLMREGLSPAGDFDGMKIRGTPPIHSTIKALGGSPVVLPGGEIYTSLERGVVDGANWPVLGAVAFKWYEVAKGFTRPAIGNTTHPILINLDTWNALSADEQAILAEQGKQLELDVRQRFDVWEAEEEKKLVELGMKRIDFAPDVAAREIKAQSEGYWAIAGKRDPDLTAELYKIAAANDLLFAPAE
ncbi:Monocarboxylate 2-oxoacid-binding periplasmic protein precursor [Oceanibacterium hippocampi]|uniref:Monocarboxylate 2-oxoacid-binding periplasmic protein n=2 Tax=Oceanibacterium hippocampi TaxID=745714 RepID=A0A1Y5RCJ6_9PROT|nr:Monocarboxylate 2-oxoacid-binding periplasmic protein precursor [Oceanibacterium hippocampi]